MFPQSQIICKTLDMLLSVSFSFSTPQKMFLFVLFETKPNGLNAMPTVFKMKELFSPK